MAIEAKVLVVEDNESSFYYLRTVLEKIGMSVIHAVNGQEAAEICLSNSKIKMVLMDINLSGMNSFEATKIIKSTLAGTTYYCLNCLCRKRR